MYYRMIRMKPDDLISADVDTDDGYDDVDDWTLE